MCLEWMVHTIGHMYLGPDGSTVRLPMPPRVVMPFIPIVIHPHSYLYNGRACQRLITPTDGHAHPFPKYCYGWYAVRDMFPSATDSIAWTVRHMFLWHQLYGPSVICFPLVTNWYGPSVISPLLVTNCMV